MYTSMITFTYTSQNQDFKDHPEHFKSIGDFTLDGEGGSDIPKVTAKKKQAGKASRQQSLSGKCRDGRITCYV